MSPHLAASSTSLACTAKVQDPIGPCLSKPDEGTLHPGVTFRARSLFSLNYVITSGGYDKFQDGGGGLEQGVMLDAHFRPL